MVEVIETLKGEVFLLDLLDHLLWQFLELSQRRHRLPPLANTDTEYEQPALANKTQHSPASGQERITNLHSLVDHLAKIHGLVCQLSPAPVEYNLKYGPH